MNLRDRDLRVRGLWFEVLWSGVQDRTRGRAVCPEWIAERKTE